MNLKKTLLSGLLAVTFTFSIFGTTFANPEKNSQQNDLYGEDWEKLQLGDWAVDSEGNYLFNYNIKQSYDYNEDIVDDFNLAKWADDKGLIPPSLRKTYSNPSTWAKSEVVKAAKMGLSNIDIIADYQGDITRVEFTRTAVQMYYKYAQWLPFEKEVPDPIETDIFDDIDVDENPENLPIIHASYLGITQGVGNNLFAPDRLITREEMATMLFRLCELFDINFGTYQNMLNYFTDYKQTSSWARPAVAALGNAEIFLGYPVANPSDIGKTSYSNTEFRPKTNTTNEQALCLILRIAEKYLDPQVSHIIGTPLVANTYGTILRWNPVYGADLYEINKYKYVSDDTTTLEETYNVHSVAQELEVYTDEGLPTCELGSGVFDFTVRPLNEFDSGFESQAVRVIVPHPVEKASVKITDNGNGTANLSWDNVAHFDVAGGDDDKGATKYRVLIRDNRTNDILENKFVTEAQDADGDNDISNDRTSMTLNEPLVDTIGTFKVIIYAYNQSFASAPITSQYEVEEITRDSNVQKTINIEGTDLNVFSVNGVEIYPLQDANGGTTYYRVDDNTEYDIGSSTPTAVMIPETVLIIKQI